MATKRRELSLLERNAIVGLQLQIVAYCSANNIMKRLKDRGSVENPSQSGRPSLSKRDARKFGSVVKKKQTQKPQKSPLHDISRALKS